MDESSAPRRTKIVATLGPASSSEAVIEALVRAGMDVARLNFSHGSHEDHQRTYDRIRNAEVRVGRPIAVLQDLQGPKIRLGKVDGIVEIAAGDRVSLSSKSDFVGSRARLPTTYLELAKDVRVGEPILLCDGALELVCEAIEGDEVACRVLVGGMVSSNKGMNLPASNTSVPAASEKDLRDLAFGLELGVDYVALSFVRAPQDVLALRQRMDDLGRRVPIISKIEKPQAIDRLESIVEVSDGVMIARGDLGVELPPERVPPIQRRTLRLAAERAVPAIVATQMLVSMTQHPRPTHAEVSDVANAVYDGADCVMLSEETASGANPVRALETMAAIAAAADNAPIGRERPPLLPELANSSAGAIARAAVGLAQDIGAKALVGFTQLGLGPRLLANRRPRCEIIGFSSTPESVRRLGLYWGVRPILISAPTSVESLVAAVEAQRAILPPGAKVVITSKMPFIERELTNMLKIHTMSGGTQPPSLAPGP